MRGLLWISFVGILRDRAVFSLLPLMGLLVLIPSASSLSMRQVTELAITLSLSLDSFVLLVISVFFSSFSIWRDIERRYTFSVLALPISRDLFVLAKFGSIALFIVLCGVLFGLVSPAVILNTASQYPPDRGLIWFNIYISIIFDVLKYILICAFGILFSVVSTSYFLPIFGTVSVFILGCISQDVKNYLSSSVASDVPYVIKNIAKYLYFVIPNLDAFDYKYAAIYSIPIDKTEMLLSLLYFLGYTSTVIFLACLVFRRRELR